MKSLQWIAPSLTSPDEGERVDVKLTTGVIVPGVEFARGRFWKYRKPGQPAAGHAYDVQSWRSRETQTTKKGDISGDREEGREPSGDSSGSAESKD